VFLDIDGSQGEGGGQILRSSLTLAAVTGQPVRIQRIRAGRAKPGLLAQHLAAVRAARDVAGAHVRGDEQGSQSLEFVPSTIRPGAFEFAVRTAGSSTLVCQTVLGMLLSVPGKSSLVFSGGTHNPMAPPYDFLDLVYFPVLRRMGARLSSHIDKLGFYPAGGGSFRVELEVVSRLSPIDIVERQPDLAPSAWAWSAHVPEAVTERELSLVRDALSLTDAQVQARRAQGPGSGNVLCIQVGPHELVTAFGERGRRAEQVAGDAIGQACRYLADTYPVGEHLADQLVVPFALFGGTFRTGTLSQHTRTNIEVVRAFLGTEAVVVSELPGGAELQFRGMRP